MSAPDQNVFMFTLDADSIRSHFEGVGDRDDRYPSTEQQIERVTDAALNEAGAVMINRLSDALWAAIDDLFIQAATLAVDTNRRDPLAGNDSGPCSDFAPDTAHPDPADRDVCTTCFHRGSDHETNQKASTT